MVEKFIVSSVLVILGSYSYGQESTFDQEARRQMLLPPTGKVDIVLDTDTYNEIDDQFALVYALLSPDRINVKAIFAAPYYNKRSSGPRDGMEKSYEEILRVCRFLKVQSNGMAYRGSEGFMDKTKTPFESPAVDRLIELSKDYSPDNPLYVVAIGAITNIASAILIEPEITSKIVLVWVAGNSDFWPKATEFNSEQDIASTQVIFDSGVPLIQVPAHPVTTHLTTTLAEINESLSMKGELSKYLSAIFEDYIKGYRKVGTSKIIWDIGGIAWLVNAEWVPSELMRSPVITDQHTYSYDSGRHWIRRAYYVKRDPIFNDLFTKINKQE